MLSTNILTHKDKKIVIPKIKIIYINIVCTLIVKTIQVAITEKESKKSRI
jgi:hypothetical protein